MSKITKIIMIFIIFDLVVIGGYFGYKTLSGGGSGDSDYEWIQIDAYYTPLDDIEAFIKQDAEERDMLPVKVKNYGKDTKVLRKFRGKNFAGASETQIKLKYREIETWQLVELKYTADTGREAQRAILYVYEHQQWKVGDSGTIAQ